MLAVRVAAENGLRAMKIYRSYLQSQIGVDALPSGNIETGNEWADKLVGKATNKYNPVKKAASAADALDPFGASKKSGQEFAIFILGHAIAEGEGLLTEAKAAEAEAKAEMENIVIVHQPTQAQTDAYLLATQTLDTYKAKRDADLLVWETYRGALERAKQENRIEFERCSAAAKLQQPADTDEPETSDTPDEPETSSGTDDQAPSTVGSDPNVTDIDVSGPETPGFGTIGFSGFDFDFSGLEFDLDFDADFDLNLDFDFGFPEIAEGVNPYSTSKQDVTPPSVTQIDAPANFTGVLPFEISVTYSELVGNATDPGDIIVTQATIGAITTINNITYRATVTPLGSGDISITVPAGAARDIAGNLNIASQSVSVANMTAESTQQTISSFSSSRTTSILSLQPDLVAYLDGSSGHGIGPLGFTAFEDDTNSMQLAFSTSLRRVENDASRRLALSYGKTPGSTSAHKQPDRRYDVWAEVYGSRTKSGLFSNTLWVGYVGSHIFVTPDLIVGGMAQLDWADQSNKIAGSTTDGFGWMAGPYIAGRIPNTKLKFSANAAWGQSNNTVSPVGTYSDTFDTERWMLAGTINGSFDMAALTVKPSVSVSYFSETQKAYTDNLGNVVSAQTSSQGAVRFGPEVSRQYEIGEGVIVEPSLGVSGIWNFGMSDGAGVTAAPLGNRQLRARVDSGLTILTPKGWIYMMNGFYDGIGVTGYQSVGGRVRLTVPLN
ncbi:outer membrane autotransporter barrel domain-containing protein [Hoeflea sp. IMCC20628]|uniref:autotransporter outer membrane beta-barrel domain-containing protein n=1 Tax=Hoeflea sp. IMCC20628 TaxID=1620421 RepID=UPI00063BF0D1|nr:autotransporter outer membrane beta-barrel domain-containing protein [Hoeflea sp. IMCC20628]AKI02409.1 outer membrane autotransporter barrel domain-containing protein [Hoeflea sp. IMCC20628]